MQTIYYTTPNFIHHTGNVVDLDEYRQKLALSQEGSLAPQPREEDYFVPDGEEAWEEPRLREVRPRRGGKLGLRALVLDACASLCVVVMTLTFTLRVLMA